MEVRPVRNYKEPGYPGERAVQEHPELLEHLPERWRRNPAVTAALSMCAAALLTGCAAGREYVAPVFSHGEGSIGFGCSSVIRNFYLTEEEAGEIIRLEALEYGDLRLEVNEEARRKNAWKQEKKPLDLISEDGRIAVEFISGQDTGAWGAVEDYGTAGVYKVKETAEAFQKQLTKRKDGQYIGVLYEPGSGEEIIEELLELRDSLKGANPADAERLETERGKEYAEEELRAQVRDFIDWLEAEGVLAS